MRSTKWVLIGRIMGGLAILLVLWEEFVRMHR